MASFSDKDFNSAAYRDLRPRYGEYLYNQIYEFHISDSEAKFDQAVDLATGTGQAAIDLANKFKSVQAFDISATMLKCEPWFSAAMPHPKVTYAEGRDTHIPVPDNSVDLLAVAEAAHYFDFDAFLKEADRVLKPSGTLAFWAYFLFEIKEYPHIAKLINDFHYYDLEEYFDKRRHRLDNWYADYSLDAYFPHSTRIMLPNNVVSNMTIKTLLDYPTTWSGYQTYRSQCNDQPDRFEEIKKEILDSLGGNTEEVLNKVVNVCWPTILIMGKRR